jgi:hypothetical protein
MNCAMLSRTTRRTRLWRRYSGGSDGTSARLRGRPLLALALDRGDGPTCRDRHCRASSARRSDR